MTTKAATCAHDYRIIDTQINRMYDAAENPVFHLACRRCGAKEQARGQVALSKLVALRTKERGLG